MLAPLPLLHRAAGPRSTLDPDTRTRGPFWNRQSTHTFPLPSAFMFFLLRVADALLQVEMNALIFLFFLEMC